MLRPAGLIMTSLALLARAGNPVNGLESEVESGQLNPQDLQAQQTKTFDAKEEISIWDGLLFGKVLHHPILLQHPPLLQYFTFNTFQTLVSIINQH